MVFFLTISDWQKLSIDTTRLNYNNDA
jgi:hypothetical protein